MGTSLLMKTARRAPALGLAGSISCLLAGFACSPPAGTAQIQFISGSPTGGWFPVASVIAEHTNRLYQGQPISVIPGAGGVGNPFRVGSGQSEIGISYAPFLRMAQQGGNEIYKEAYPYLRSIAAMIPNQLHLVAGPELAGMGLGNLARRKPRLRVGTGPVGSVELFMLEQVLRYYGVSYQDLESWSGRVDRLNTGGRTDGWKNRQLDLVSYFINSPAASLIELMSIQKGSRLLSLDESVRDRMVEDWGMMKFTIPAHRYPGQPEDVRTVGMPFVLFAPTELDDELVYNMTKTIAEGQKSLIAAHSAFSEWKPEDMPQGVGIELHQGAERYYRERGWLP